MTEFYVLVTREIDKKTVAISKMFNKKPAQGKKEYIAKTQKIPVSKFPCQSSLPTPGSLSSPRKPWMKMKSNLKIQFWENVLYHAFYRHL